MQGFVERCEALGPVVAAGAVQAEELRRVPDEVMAAAAEADLFRAVVPPSLGGQGVTLRELCDGTRILAHGCPATAWTLSFLVMHTWLLGRFPAPGRAQLFSNGHVPLVAAPLAPTGRMTAVDGGYTVSGRWEWATGIAHSDHCMVHGIDDPTAFTTRFALVPVADLTVEDTWHTSGMRATGSHTVVVDDVFVPSELTCSGDALRGGGGGPSDDRLAPLPLLSVLGLVASAPAVGAAEAAVGLFREQAQRRVLAYTLGDRAADQPHVRARLAAVTSALETMRAGWWAAIDEIAAAERPDDELRGRTRLAAAAAVRSSRRTISDVAEGAGASVYFESHPLQRLQRDVETLKGHVVFDWDRATELAGRVLLGQPLQPTDMA
ncbi:MAG: acyl-CoA dehydrogenase family protein [Actinomycetota bacterium]